MGGEWTTGRITFLFKAGLRLMTETTARTRSDAHVSVNGEEEFDNLVVLEDESDD
jgi:hypothetical protein